MTEDLNKYVNNLLEIKRRIEVVTDHLYHVESTKYVITEVEFLCLQFRKILELIALSSLIANRKEYSEVHDKFARHYNARLILQDLQRVNKDFYPVPTRQRIVVRDGQKYFDLEPVLEGYLTKDEFFEVYEKCGGMMHATNPYGQERDFEGIRKQFPSWRDKIVKLLNHHNIALVDGETMIAGLMHGEKDGMPQASEFKIVKGTDADRVKNILGK